MDKIVFYKGLREIDDTDGIKSEVQQTITTKIRDFHNESIHLPGTEMETEYLRPTDKNSCFCFLNVLANGDGEENEGYVTIKIGKMFYETAVEGSIITSVIDSSNSERLSQTFILTDLMFIRDTHNSINSTRDSFKNFKYISRKRLLSDPDELLPGDILTLMIDVRIRITGSPEKNYDDQNLNSCLRMYHYAEPFCCELLLDSPLGTSLSQESSVFKEMLNLKGMEKGTEFMSMPVKDVEEGCAFHNCCRLLMGYDLYPFLSMKDVFDIYIIAEKFDIKSVMETCVCLMKLYASVHTVGVLFTYANEYKEYHSNLLKEQITLISQANLAEEIVKTKLHVRFIEPVHNCLWAYQYSIQNIFVNINSPFLSPNVEEDADYDFYK